MCFGDYESAAILAFLAAPPGLLTIWMRCIFAALYKALALAMIPPGGSALPDGLCTVLLY